MGGLLIREDGRFFYMLAAGALEAVAVSAGPVEPRAEPRSYAPAPSRRSSAMREVPEYESYMSGRCRTLQNSIRGASANGSSYDVIAGMQREYRRDCSDEESDAASRYYRERREARDAREREHEQDEASETAHETSSLG